MNITGKILNFKILKFLAFGTNCQGGRNEVKALHNEHNEWLRKSMQ